MKERLVNSTYSQEDLIPLKIAIMSISEDNFMATITMIENQLTQMEKDYGVDNFVCRKALELVQIEGGAHSEYYQPKEGEVLLTKFQLLEVLRRRLSG